MYETTYHTQEQKHTTITFTSAKVYRCFHEVAFSISSLDMSGGWVGNRNWGENMFNQILSIDSSSWGVSDWLPCPVTTNLNIGYIAPQTTCWLTQRPLANGGHLGLNRVLWRRLMSNCPHMSSGLAQSTGQYGRQGQPFLLCVLVPRQRATSDSMGIPRLGSNRRAMGISTGLDLSAPGAAGKLPACLLPGQRVAHSLHHYILLTFSKCKNLILVLAPCYNFSCGFEERGTQPGRSYSKCKGGPFKRHDICMLYNNWLHGRWK